MHTFPNLLTKRVFVLVAVLVGVSVTAKYASALTEVARSPWQITSQATCTTGFCSALFPQIATNRRLDIQFVSCFVLGDADVGVLLATLGSNLSLTLKHYLAPTARTAGLNYIVDISQPVVFAVPAGHRPQIDIEFLGTASSSRCTLSGQLVFLQ